MHRWVRRSLQTALLTGGLLAVGTGIAAADENDLAAESAGATATVPVEDGTVVQVPVVTGTGQDLAVTGQGAQPVVTLPVDTNTAPGTTVQLGDAASSRISAPVRVVEADSTPDPDGDLAVTVPINTSGGKSAAGTTVETSVVRGNIGDLLDGGPASGADVTVDLHDLVVPGPSGDAGDSIDLLPDPVVTIGDTSPGTARNDVLAVPVSLEEGEPSTVGLPVRPRGDGGIGSLTSAPLSEDTVVVVLGDLFPDAPDSREGDYSEPDDEVLSIPVELGNVLPPDVLDDPGLSGDTVVVDLGNALGLGGNGGGSVIAVPVNEGRDGLLGDDLVLVRLLVLGSGGQDGAGHGGDGGASPATAPATPVGAGSGVASPEGSGMPGTGPTGSASTGSALLCAEPGDPSAGGTAGKGAAPAAPHNGAAVSPCGLGTASASRPAALPERPGQTGLGLAGTLALSTAVLLARARRRSVLNRG